MAALRPRKALFDPEFIAANQAERADNVIQGRWGACDVTEGAWSVFDVIVDTGVMLGIGGWGIFSKFSV